jgi:putative ABC transport system substrate-binding protein
MGASVAWPFAAMAQQAGRTYRIGGLSAGPRNSAPIVAMLDELRRFGFIEGQNLMIDWREYRLRVDLISEFAADLVKVKVDVIYAAGDAAIRAVQRATTTIPILGNTEDMVGSGLVNSLARPGGNTTGLSILAAELDGKRQEILIEAVPGLHRMAALADSNTTAPPRLQALQDAAGARGVELSIHQIARAEEIPAAIDAANASGAAALNVLSAPLLYTAKPGRLRWCIRGGETAAPRRVDCCRGPSHLHPRPNPSVEDSAALKLVVRRAALRAAS